MTNPKTPPIIISIDKNKISLCSPTHASPLVFQFTPSMVADLEVINKEELTASLTTFIQKSQISPSSLVIVLAASISFDQDFPGPTPPSPDQIQKFQDTIPFSAISSKLFKSNKNYKLVVINRDYYETIKAVFQKLSFEVLAVVPSFVLNPLGLSDDLTASACTLLLKKINFLTDNSFISSATDDSRSFQQKEQAFLTRHQTPAVVVSILLVIASLTTAVVFLTRRSSPPAAPVSTPRPLSTPVSILLPSPSPSPAVNLAAYSVQIINGSTVSGLATQLEDQLRPLGFTQITTTTTSATSGTALVVFRPTVPDAARQLILAETQKLSADPSVQDNPQAQFDITITLSQITP